MTCDEMRAFLTGWSVEEALKTGRVAGFPLGEAHGSDEVDFGRHKGLMYREVYESFPKYCNWVLEQIHSGEEVSPQLARLGAWLDKMNRMCSHDPENVDEMETDDHGPEEDPAVPLRRRAPQEDYFQMDDPDKEPEESDGEAEQPPNVIQRLLREWDVIHNSKSSSSDSGWTSLKQQPTPKWDPKAKARPPTMPVSRAEAAARLARGVWS